MEDQIIISRTKLEGLESDSRKYRDEMVAEKEKLGNEYKLELDRMKQGGILINSDSWRPWYIFSKDELVIALGNEVKTLREFKEKNETVAYELFQLGLRVERYNNLPWHKRIFTKP